MPTPIKTLTAEDGKQHKLSGVRPLAQGDTYVYLIGINTWQTDTCPGSAVVLVELAPDPYPNDSDV